MSDKQILEIMQAVHSVHPDTNVEEAVQKMSSQRVDVLLIKDLGEYTGIFTKADLISYWKKILTLLRSAFPPLCQNPFSLLMQTLPWKKHGKRWWKISSGITP